jgi:phosphatidylinositol alpha-1,6-mannosyltransferase
MPLRVLFVSKPIAPPFRDGAKCLVRDVALHLERTQATVMATPGAPPLGSVEVAPAYAESGNFTPTLAANGRAALWLLTRSRADLWHFVFGPNPRSSAVARWLARLRRVPVLQTVASPPRDFAQTPRLLFGDLVVAQSEWTRQRLLRAGASERGTRVEVVPPPLGEIAARSPDAIASQRRELGIDEGVPVFVYPGDLEVSGGAEAVAAAVEPVRRVLEDAVFVFACRFKTPAAPAIARALGQRLGPERARFTSDPTDVLALIAGATAVLFPVDDLWSKVDLPIVLLESMSLGVPVAVSDQGPLRELDGALKFPPGDPPALVEAALALASNRELRQETIAQQREAVVRSYAAPVVAAQYERFYEELARSKGVG